MERVRAIDVCRYVRGGAARGPYTCTWRALERRAHVSCSLLKAPDGRWTIIFMNTNKPRLLNLNVPLSVHRAVRLKLVGWIRGGRSEGTLSPEYICALRSSPARTCSTALPAFLVRRPAGARTDDRLVLSRSLCPFRSVRTQH